MDKVKHLLNELIEQVYEDNLSGKSTPMGKPCDPPPEVTETMGSILDELAALRAENERLRAENKELLNRIDILGGGLVCAQCGISPYEGGLDEPF